MNRAAHDIPYLTGSDATSVPAVCRMTAELGRTRRRYKPDACWAWEVKGHKDRDFDPVTGTLTQDGKSLYGMKIEEIYPEGSFAQWPHALRKELETHGLNQRVGQTLCFENEQLRLWSILLPPGQRLGFHRHTRDYSWTCLSAGTAVTRYGTGDVYRVTYVRGDLGFHCADNGEFVHDLENIGDTTLEFVTTEYLR